MEGNVNRALSGLVVFVALSDAHVCRAYLKVSMMKGAPTSIDDYAAKVSDDGGPSPM